MTPTGYGSPVTQLAQTGANNKQNNAGWIISAYHLECLIRKKENKNGIKLNP